MGMLRNLVVATAASAALLLAVAGQAGAGRWVDVEVYDRTAGRVMPLHRHGGDYYVVGRPGHAYELRLRNRGSERLLAVTSVDGVNVVTGETASPEQGGYVLERHGAVTVSGWRKSLAEVAAFEFTALHDSYAARTGRPHDVGVIGAAIFREAPVYRGRDHDAQIARESAPASPVLPQRTAPTTDSSRAPEPAAETQSARGAYGEISAPAPREQLGTGHGQREWSSARYTQFRRASRQPVEVVEIRYDSEANLIARGIIPVPHRPTYPHRPRAFPGAFVPDP